jgi:hypothetical protein
VSQHAIRVRVSAQVHNVARDARAPGTLPGRVSIACSKRGALRGAVAVGALALVLMHPSPASAQEPYFGASLNGIFQQRVEPDRWAALLNGVRAAGIRQGRSDAFWFWAERGRPFDLDVPLWDWSRTDLMVREMAERGIAWLPVLDGAPPWERVDRRDVQSPPRSMEHYARYAAEFARRYGRGGSFWAEADGLPYLPVTTYEIWNEPNMSNFWAPHVEPDRYADMYVRAREAIHAVDPAAVAMVGGLTVPMGGFVEDMIAARPDLAGAIDAVGLHPYSRSGRGTVAWVNKLRKTLDQLGQREVPVFVTELGWPTRGRYTGRTMEDEDRAFAMELAGNTLARGNCGVRSVIANTWVSPQKDPDLDDDWYGFYALGRGLDKTGEAYAALIATHPEQHAGTVPACGPLAHAPAGPDVDTDRDGVPDGREAELGASLLDRDTDDDGVADAAEARGGTDPARADTDRDGLADGLELGHRHPIGEPRGVLRGTNRVRFRPDADTRTRTSPLRADTDGDGRADGTEDANRNGRRDRGETNPLRRD